MDEIRNLIWRFENAVKRYDSCQPHTAGEWRADLAHHRKRDSEILADLQRRFAPSSGDQNRRHRSKTRA
jgi:hypothetical protein